MKKSNTMINSPRPSGGFINPTTSGLLAVLVCSSIIYSGCGKGNDDEIVATPSYKTVALVADVTGYGAARVDPDLANPWGIAVGGTGAIWIAANHTGYTTVYDRNGAELLPSVDVPFNGDLNGGAPTGVVYNTTSDFIIPATGEASKFVYVTENGTIAAWSSGTATVTVADRSSSDAVYKGIAMASDGGANFIYAANFKEGKIDVFDADFQYTTGRSFSDPGIPSSFAPFNIQNIDGQLYVAYAKHKGPDNEDDQKGAGNGYIDVFNPDGSLVKRFASKGTLNSPWAITTVSAGFGLPAGSILVGNFGDGRINIFSGSGRYQGQLMNGNTPLKIEGLWALVFPRNGIPSGNPDQLFYTAGPADEEHGVFGYIEMK